MQVYWFCVLSLHQTSINHLTPNDHYSGRTAPLTCKRFFFYIYSINIGTEYFKHGIYSPFFPLQNAVCFIILTYLVPVLFTFYIHGVLKLKKIIPAPKVNYAHCFMIYRLDMAAFRKNFSRLSWYYWNATKTVIIECCVVFKICCHMWLYIPKVSGTDVSRAPEMLSLLRNVRN